MNGIPFGGFELRDHIWIIDIMKINFNMNFGRFNGLNKYLRMWLIR